MKLSLHWINRHLKHHSSSPVEYSYAQMIAQKLSHSTAEIDSIEEILLDKHRYTLAEIKTLTPDGKASYYSPEIDQYIVDAAEPHAPISTLFLFYYDTERHRWRRAAYHDIGATRDGNLPALYVPETQRNGAWKSTCVWHDIRFILDNKAITHRPDLWCHRGFARELAPLINDELIDLCELNDASRYTIRQEELMPHVVSPAVTTVGLLSLNHIQVTHSLPSLCLLLARMDTRAINSIVDLTNYLMFDIGQPMHAFDAAQIQGAVTIRNAKPAEHLELLDGTPCTLNTEDCIVADASGPLSLTGIMGGSRAAVTLTTQAIMVEAVQCNAYTIRMTAHRHKIRTESSTRFEKGTDATNIAAALQLFAQQSTMHSKDSDAIITLYGAQKNRRLIDLTEQLCMRILGIAVPQDTIRTILKSLGYSYTYHDRSYTIEVPSWRTADINGPEDIVEDIARRIGYNSIPGILPQRVMQPVKHNTVDKTRFIKRHLAYAAHMQEVCSYPFYDEQLLTAVGITDTAALTLRNPLSANTTHLITSLIPQLIQYLLDNHNTSDHIRIFELGKLWQKTSRQTIQEQKVVAALIYQPQSITFYEGKAIIMSLFDLLRMPIRWAEPTGILPAWCARGATAELWHQEQKIGYAGLLHKPIGSTLYQELKDREVFIFEADATVLIDYQAPSPSYTKQSKYQSVHSDISILAPYSKTTEQFIEQFLSADPRIILVELKDMFEQKAWKDQRSLTFRITLNDATKTMTSDEINGIMQTIQQIAAREGATVR